MVPVVEDTAGNGDVVEGNPVWVAGAVVEPEKARTAASKVAALADTALVISAVAAAAEAVVVRISVPRVCLVSSG